MSRKVGSHGKTFSFLTLAMRFTVLYLIAGSILIGSNLYSQIGATPKVELYNLSLFFINYQETDNPRIRTTGINLKFISKGEVRRIGVDVGSLTREFSYTGQSNFSFVEEIVDEEGVITHVPILGADLGAKGRKVILIIRDPSGRLLSRVFDIGSSRFSKDSIRCINLARKQIRAKIGSSVRDISPMSVIDFEVRGDSRKFLIPFILATAGQGDQPVIIEKSRLAFKQGGRILLFLYHDPADLSRIKYRRSILSEEILYEDISDDEVEETIELDDDVTRREEMMESGL